MYIIIYIKKKKSVWRTGLFLTLTFQIYDKTKEKTIEEFH